LASFGAPSSLDPVKAVPNPDYPGTVHVYQTFTVDASFASGKCAKCSCCQYRQYVRGFFKYKAPGDLNWQSEYPPKTLANGNLLSETVFQEDGDEDGNAYGHPGPDEDAFNEYSDDGCSYFCQDSPGVGSVSLRAGNEIWIKLDFQFIIIDVCNEQNNVTVVNWPFEWQWKPNP